jgi:hypothetical protein
MYKLPFAGAADWRRDGSIVTAYGAACMHLLRVFLQGH